MNKQRPERPFDIHDGEFLEVHSIFHTIQGEGPFAGTPAVFVRLAGCNLQCPLCDTQYTEGRRQWAIRDIVEQVELHMEYGLVVVTGGEPFRQTLVPLFKGLTAAGFYVQVETNGSLEVPEMDFQQDPVFREGVYIVCSPKKKVHPSVWNAACALKYVVQAGKVAEDGLPTGVLGYRLAPDRPPEGWEQPIYIQPADQQDDELNELNTKVAVKSAMDNNYILQLQIHKILGME